MKILSSEYATFRRVQEYITKKILPSYSVIFDPMAGTAPLIPYAETHGYVAYFNDILPIHLYVNRAKTYQIYQCYKRHGYEWFSKELLRCMNNLKGKSLCISEKWIDDSVLDGLIKAWHKTKGYERNVTTLLRATIILCVRPLSSITKSENPTWFKPGGMSSNKDLKEIVEESLTIFDKFYHFFYKSPIIKRGRCFFTARNAAELRLPQKIDLILTSPPYCNRLDTTIQYGPENYFLSAVGHSIPKKDIIGTTIVRDYETFDPDFEYLTGNSEYANRLLNKMRSSPKRDDPAYYLKYYTRYFAMVYRTFDNVLHNLSSSGKMYFIVQDNTHRGELIKIDKLLTDLLRANGWQFRTIKKWERHHLGLRNISRNHAFIRPKQAEKLVVIFR